MSRIMIVDDSLFMRRVLHDVLAEGGHTIVAEAKDGVEAIQLYGTYEPDVVTMDVTMPVMDGVQALEKIVALYPEAKIIMVSAMGQQALVLKAIRLGAKGFITKPFRPSTVLQEITICL